MSSPLIVGSGDLQARFLARSIRQVELPPALAPRAGWGCDAYHPDVDGACFTGPGAGLPAARYATGETNFGTYPPFGYLPAAAGVAFAPDPLSALYLARLVEAALAVGLLVLTVWLLWDAAAGALSLAGLAVATTPMVLFVATQLSPSSLEVTAAIALNAALLRLARPIVRSAGEPPSPPSPPSTLAWDAAGLAAVVLALSRPLGPFWVLLAAGLWLLWVRPVGARMTFGRAAAAATLAFAAASTLTLGWLLLAHAGPGGGLGQTLAGIPQALASVPETLGEAIGVFGALDTLLPKPVYALWGLALVAAFAVPALTAGARGRHQVDAVLVTATLAILAVALFVSLPTGFAPQGRQILPALVPLPLYGAEALMAASRRSAPVGRAATAVLLAAPPLQLLALWANAVRYAHGASGAWAFWSGPAWSPPLGWPAWSALALVAIALAVAAATAARRPGSAPALRPGR